MLVMRRRAGESFLIGPDIEIQILEISHSRVRIGVTAPSNVQIVRKEVVLTREENRTAAHTISTEGIAWITEQLRSSRSNSSEKSQKNSRNRSVDPDM